MKKITIVIPTYNEADNVRPMTEALLSLDLPTLDILIVDDDSPDSTGQIADKLAAQHPDRVYVCHRTGKKGLGRSYIEGFQSALDRGADVIVQMDCDFSHSPSDVPRLVSHIPDYDVVVGSRYVEGGELDEDWEFGRVLLSWWANAYSRIILGLKVRDITAGFKAWRRGVLESIDLDRIHAQGYVFQVEMAFVAERLGYRLLEVPIYFEDRRIGESKMTISVKLEAALRVWEIWWRWRNLQPSMRLAE
jgi:dolichol-phosphate mannosyltransferase